MRTLKDAVSGVEIELEYDCYEDSRLDVQTTFEDALFCEDGISRLDLEYESF